MRKKWRASTFTKDPDAILSGIIGEKYSAYRDKWKAASGLCLVQDYPIHIDFELRFGCNLRCPQCVMQVKASEFGKSHPYHMDNRRKFISYDKFKEIIDEGSEKGLCSITLNVNNEPLLVKDIAEYVRYARSKGIVDVIMLTNAALLDRKMSRKLIEAGLTKIYFSLDAVKEDTYKVVRKGGDYKKAVANILGFLEVKKELGSALPVTRVSFVRNKVNAPEEKEFLAFWSDKVDFVSIQAFVNPAYGYSNYETVKEMFYLKNEDLKNPGPCSQPYQRLTIYNDGSAHPCCPWYGALLTVGNVNDHSVHEIWNSDGMKALREKVNSADVAEVPEACRICRKESA